jgi:hypothetical protein
MMFVVIETQEDEEPDMRVLYIGGSQSEVKSYLQAMKNLAKPQGLWNPNAIKVLPYESE